MKTDTFESRVRKKDEKLFRILQDLECRLQELGVRPDFGIPHEPSFATETLVSCLEYVANLKDAREGLLQEAAQDLLDASITREKGERSVCVTMTESHTAHVANTQSFMKLVNEYRALFQRPISATMVAL